MGKKERYLKLVSIILKVTAPHFIPSYTSQNQTFAILSKEQIWWERPYASTAIFITSHHFNQSSTQMVPWETFPWKNHSYSSEGKTPRCADIRNVALGEGMYSWCSDCQVGLVWWFLLQDNPQGWGHRRGWVQTIHIIKLGEWLLLLHYLIVSTVRYFSTHIYSKLGTD
jgi:hypothetical protein